MEDACRDAMGTSRSEIFVSKGTKGMHDKQYSSAWNKIERKMTNTNQLMVMKFAGLPVNS